MNGLTDLILNGIFDSYTFINGFVVLKKMVGCVTEDDINQILNTVTIDNQPISPHLVFKSDYQVITIG